MENIRYKEALTNATCPNCGGPAAIGEMSFDEQHLRIENARLREEVNQLKTQIPIIKHDSISQFPSYNSGF